MNVTASLQIKRNIYQVVLSYKDINGERKQKWISTGISAKGNNKRLANAKLEEIKKNYKKYIPSLLTSNENESYKHNIEENTYDSYCTVVNKITNYFSGKNIKLKDLKPKHIQDFYNSLYKKGLSPNTVLHYHANIRKALDIAMKLEIIPNNPADRIERPKKSQFIGDFYSIDELEKLFSACRNDPIEIVVLIASFYGLRRSEVLGLKWSSIDFEKNIITIKHKVIQRNAKKNRSMVLKDKTKNKASYRSLPLLPTIATALKKHKNQINKNKLICGNTYHKEFEDYICVDFKGKLFRPEYITDHFQIILKNNGLRHIRFHDLRHSCASLLLSKGVPMKAIQEWLGHSTYSTTANFYAHLEDNYKSFSADVLSSSLKVV